MPQSHVVAVGASFKTAQLAARERLAIGAEEAPDVLHYLREYAQEAMVLSTCNRTEIYLVATDVQQALFGATSLLAARSGMTAAELQSNLYSMSDRPAVRHLLLVAAGMDSLVPGEHEIMGQIRAAVQNAQQSRTLGAVLTHLAQSALRAGRRARAETAIGRHPASVSLAAVRLAQQICGRLEHRSALVLGAGKTAHLVSQALRSYKIGQLNVVSRTLSRATDMACRVGGTAWDMRRLEFLMASADLIISCTSAKGIVLSADQVASALGPEPRDTRLFVDLAVPRDIDPRVRELEGVALYDLDDLRSICDRNQAARRAAQAEVDAIVTQGADAFQQWLDSRDTVEFVARLRVWAETVARTELSKTTRYCGDLTEEQRQRLEAMALAVVGKLLHAPTVHLKSLGPQEASRALQEVFALAPAGGGALYGLTESLGERVKYG